MKSYIEFINEDFNWQNEFSFDEKEIIKDQAKNQIADLVYNGQTTGKLFGEGYKGKFDFESTELFDNEEYMADQIRQGKTSGYLPKWILKVDIWRD